MDTSLRPPAVDQHQSSSSTFVTSFPILAITIIGIFTTGILLVSYYVFVIKCCLNWRHTDLLRRRYHYMPPIIHDVNNECHGLEPLVIRSIPVIKFVKADGNEANRKASFLECAVCLNEFQEDERLKLLPGCFHGFHIDCIDTWLQFNANCPLCRSEITAPITSAVDHIVVLGPRQEQSGRLVVEVRDEVSDGSLIAEAPNPSLKKKGRKLHKVGSRGDECIDVRVGKDEQFCVQPLGRSFSMDSSNDRQLYLSVQWILRQKQHCFQDVEGSGEGSSSGGGAGGIVRRSFFSFGQSSRSAAIQIQIDV